MAGVRRLSILVADDDPGVIADYRAILCAPRSSSPADFRDPSGFEDDLFRVALAHERFPEVDLSVATRPEEAVQAVKRRADAGERYTMAFIGVELRDGDRGLAAAETIRAMDPDMPIALVAARCGMHPLDVYDRIPPTARIAILVKPFHAVEVQNLALSMAAGQRAEEAARAVAAVSLSFEGSAGLHEDRPTAESTSKAAGSELGHSRLDPTPLTDSDPPKPRSVRSAQSVPRIPLREARGPGSHRSDVAGALNPGRSAYRAPSADGNGRD